MSEVVAVSRRFGVAHMLVAVGLFATLFSVLEVLRAGTLVPAGLVYAFCGLFCVAVPLGQMFLYEGRCPRRASCLVGSRLLSLIAVVGVGGTLVSKLLAGWVGFGDLPQWGLFLVIVAAVAGGVGYALGYIVGTISAGVFLALDGKRELGERSAATGLETPTGVWWLDWIAWSPVRATWEGRDRPLRNGVVFTSLAVVVLGIGVPAVWPSLGWPAWGLVFGTSLVAGFALAGALLAGWRIPVGFAAAGTVWAYAIVSQGSDGSEWGALVQGSRAVGLAAACGIVLAALGAGAYGWGRWILSRSKRSIVPWRLAFSVSGGFLVGLVLLSLAVAHVLDTPREDVIRRILEENGSLQRLTPTMILTVRVDGQHADDCLIRDLGAIPEVREVIISDATLARADMESLATLPCLSHLALQNCEFPENTLQLLGRHGGLVSLQVSSASLCDEDLAVLAQLPALRTLELSGPGVSGSGLRHLAGLKDLFTVCLADTNVRGEGLRYLRNVSEVVLSGTPVGDDDLMCLAGGNSLRVLDLSKTEVTDSGLIHVGTLTSLRQLTLAGTSISGTGLAHLETLGRLTLLDLGRTEIDGAGLACLPVLPELAVLQLSDTRVSVDRVAELKRLPALTSLDLSGCRVEDANLVVLRELPLHEVNLKRTSVSREAKVKLERFWEEREASDLDTFYVW